ncbi:hypothetical protein ACIRCZ_18785 [Leifsonia sp. NPDC102414]|uniref:hypothetical protein n=1 Tax=Leifsonia sp. NPDC102414 TaxID=3364124 RepID=UPI00382A772D
MSAGEPGQGRGTHGWWRRWFAVLVLFTALAGDFWRNLISWPGFFVLAFLLVAGCSVLLIRARRFVSLRQGPMLMAVFLVLATVSIAWSAYPVASVLGVVAQWSTTVVAVWLAVCLSWAEIVRALASALRLVLGLSLLFELVVAVVVRHPVLPLWVDRGPGKLPAAFFWSRDLLLHGGQIQGVVGNSNLLGMAALLALIVFSVQLAAGMVGRVTAACWVLVSVVCVALTRSSTVTVAAVVVGIVAVFAWWSGRVGPGRRRPVVLTAVGMLFAGGERLLRSGRGFRCCWVRVPISPGG